MTNNKFTGEIEQVTQDDAKRVILVEDDSPPLSETDFKTLKKVELSSIVSPAFAAALQEGRVGRPRASNPKKQVTIRLDEDLLNTLRSSGKGWQTQVNDLLRQAWMD